MWYFAWILGLGFAVLLAILNALWLENADNRRDAFGRKRKNAEAVGAHKDSGDSTVTQGNPTEDINKSGNPEDNEP